MWLIVSRKYFRSNLQKLNSLFKVTMSQSRQYIFLFLKGLAMGAANVIPGVSGGTIAFITGIYTKLIDSLKSFDGKALQLLLKFKIKALMQHVNFSFLLVLFLGIGVSLVSLGKLLKYLFETSPVFVWSFFFGLIVASVYSVGRTIKTWNSSSIIGLVIGTAAAVSLAFFKPAQESQNFVYLMLCGVVAICSMLLPGLSGSFVLILMGNYQLIMLDAVPDFNISIIAPVAIGAGVGFILLSHGISYLLHKHELSTIGALTGFILGSLVIIWPWKNPIYLQNSDGEYLLKDGQMIVESYESYMPAADSNTFIAVGLMLVGAAVVILMDRIGKKSA